MGTRALRLITLVAVVIGAVTVVSSSASAAVPSAPRSFTGTPGDEQVTLRWEAPATNGGRTITGYRLQRTRGTTDPWTIIATLGGATRAFVDVGRTNGVTYRYRVAALNADGASPWSTTVRVTPRTTPSAPRELTATALHEAARLRWKTPTTNGGAPITGYRIQRSLDGVSWTTVTTVAADVRSYTDGGRTNGTTYRYRVAARNVAGTGTWSRIRTVTLPTVLAVDGGLNHTCALLPDRTVACWGGNTKGQLGTGDFAPSAVPLPVPGLSGVVEITAGSTFTCARLADRTVRCWGEGLSGRLGNGGTTDSNVPVAVVGLTDATAISAGLRHTCAVRAVGAVHCWGVGADGALGTGSFDNSTVPVPVSGLTGVTDVSAGGAHTCARRTDGTLRCWGVNFYGQLGDGTPTIRLQPVTVSGINTAVDVAAGGSHTCALLAGGTVSCWGADAEGELGNGSSVVPSSTPAPVPSLDDVEAIDASASSSCARRTDRTLWCWGDNATGQLGVGDTIDRPDPTVVPDLPVTRLGMGFGHTCARRTGGHLWCWGQNASGQLGTRAGAPRPSPTAVGDGL